jgi:hypothetical protein
MKARVPHIPVLIANVIYSRRLVARGDLVPVGEAMAAPLAPALALAG